MHPHDLITVHTTLDVWDAQLLQQALEAAGIVCFLDDSNLSQVNWLLTSAIGGIKVRVLSQDAQRAHEIIHELRNPETLVRSCPSCGGSDLKRLLWPGVGTLATVLLLGIPLLFKGIWKCRNCGHSWRE